MPKTIRRFSTFASFTNYAKKTKVKRLYKKNDIFYYLLCIVWQLHNKTGFSL